MFKEKNVSCLLFRIFIMDSLHYRENPICCPEFRLIGICSHDTLKDRMRFTQQLMQEDGYPKKLFCEIKTQLNYDKFCL